MPAKKHSNMTDDELVEAANALDEEIQAIKAKKAALQKERDRRHLEEKLSKFSDAEKEALGLPTTVEVEAIESEEASTGK